MNELLQLVFDMRRPYYFEYYQGSRPESERMAQWSDFVERVNNNVAALGDIESIVVKEFDFLFFYGKIPYPPICIFNQWRSSLGFYSDEREEFYKEHPEEPERLRALLRKAEALLSAKKMESHPAKLAMA